MGHRSSGGKNAPSTGKPDGRPQVKIERSSPKLVPSPDEPCIYFNIAETSASAEEIVVSMGLTFPQKGNEAQGVGRLIMTPAFAKRFVITLITTITQYESIFGDVQQPEEILAARQKNQAETNEQISTESISKASEPEDQGDRTR